MIKKSINIFGIILLVFFFQKSNAQDSDSLSSLIKLIQKGSNDSIRINANAKFLTGFEMLLKKNDSFNSNYDSLKNISVQQSEDGKFRIYTWVLPHYNGDQYDYYGFIQLKQKFKNKDTIMLYSLHDSTSFIKKPESEKLTPSRWIGAVYYGIRSEEKSGVTYYMLFGWKGINHAETSKVLEVFFLNKNTPQFGYPLFKAGSVFKNRMIFTFDALSSMVLHYDESFGGIVFDHIATNKTGENPLTGPDGSYDAFKWKKGKWQFYKDVDVRTKWKSKEEFNDPRKEK